ncbi:MAG: hypothetical protein IH861_09920, partial [Chloroflexi bacterium]|nr:hypothetical protein [Chloroflexota bacterium]
MWPKCLLTKGRIGTHTLLALLIAAIGAMVGVSQPSSVIEAQSPPYPPSDVVTGIDWDFNSIVQLAPGSDNWPITWSDDDHQYPSW